ncbi:Histidine kinase [Altererythrobacter insulae]|nr:Histidine kinase [Altererythrobacter insulae]
MDSGPEHPIASYVIAAIACVALVLLGLTFPLSLGIFVVWAGSIYLASASPPPPPEKADNGIITSESMAGLIQHSSTPLVMIEDGKVSIANRAAKRVLGSHIVGQDSRMAFRQPQAVKLLGKKKNGAAIIKGLVRRRDIWRMKRQKLSETVSVIELTNLTAEADISRAHTDFVANASHELRTPLASIIGYVETLREDPAGVDKPTAQKFLGTILKESQRLQSLVSDLMSLSRIEAVKHDEPTKIIDFATLIERAARDAAGADRLERLDFQLATTPTVRGDQQQLEQLVRNLVDNALKYGHADKLVTIKLENSSESMTCLSVTDRGDGIDPEHLPHLTRRFYRTDPGRSRAAGGTGLGLAIVKHIVERHRGRLDIDSTLGEGTTVTVRLPAVADEAD